LGEIESSLMDSFASFRSRIRGPQHHSSFLARSLTTASARNQEVLRDPRARVTAFGVEPYAASSVAQSCIGDRERAHIKRIGLWGLSKCHRNP
jgi:hypothetical protein